jgi:hypothetical protein
MKHFILGALIAGALGAVSFVSPASAQATRTWVSGVGDDANPCSRTAPCKTYAGAISKTATGGEINCLDPGGFGTLTITKAVSVVCDYTEGGVLAAGVPGFTISSATPAGSVITLKGQDIECVGTGTQGIQVLAPVTVHIHKTQIRNCRASGGNGNGILVANASGVAKVFVADSYITDNGGTTTNAGILIKPTGGAQANVSITRVHLEANTNGVFADGSGGGGASNVNVNDSVLTGSTNSGIAVSSTGAAFTALIDNSALTFNANSGLGVAGAQATARIGASTVANNVTGVSNAGGTVQSFKNNMIAANNSDGTPLTAFPGPGGPLQ